MNKIILEPKPEQTPLLVPTVRGEENGRNVVPPTRSSGGNLRPIAPREGSIPTVQGRFLSVDGRRFWIKAVTYGTFRPNSAGEPFPERTQVQQDFERMREMGVNSVRLYTPPPNWVADAALEAGLFLMPDICWGPRRCDFDDPARLQQLFDQTRLHTRRLANHPAILLYSIGNEIPPLIVRVWSETNRGVPADVE